MRNGAFSIGLVVTASVLAASVAGCANRGEATVADTSAALSPLATPRALGAIQINNPAFLSIQRDAAGQPMLGVSSFWILGGDAIHFLTNLASWPSPTVQQLTGSVLWPNEMQPAPASLQHPGYIVAGGFFFPFRDHGAISFVSADGQYTHALTPDDNTWFYHRVAFKDMNGDGRLDIVTARTHKPLIGQTESQLIWLAAPIHPLWSTWTVHKIADGPDANFRLVDLDGDGEEEIVTANFFTDSLEVYKKQAGGYVRAVIDSSIGAAFDVQATDLNGDGRLDLLVSNHVSDATAGVFAYEVPVDVLHGSWARHTLIQGIVTTNTQPGAASPGYALPFSRTTGGPPERPLILLCGDGAQTAQLLTPKSSLPTDWSYDASLILSANSTVGQAAIGDIDGDGYVEVYVPAYDANAIYAYTFAP